MTVQQTVVFGMLSDGSFSTLVACSIIEKYTGNTNLGVNDDGQVPPVIRLTAFDERTASGKRRSKSVLNSPKEILCLN